MKTGWYTEDADEPQEALQDGSGEENAGEPAPEEGSELFAEEGAQEGLTEDEAVSLVDQVADDLFGGDDDPLDETDPGETQDVDKVPMMKVATFKKRIGKIISQRQEARTAEATAKGEVARIQGELDGVKAQLTAYRAEYGDNPTLAVWDAKFMAAADKMASTDPELAAVLKRVADKMDTNLDHLKPGGLTQMATQNTDTKAAPKDTKVQPEVGKALAKLARREVQDTLVGVKPAIQSLVADHIIATQNERLGDIEADEIRSIAKDFFRTKGLTKDDVLVTPKPKDPVTGGSQSHSRDTGAPRSSDTTPGNPQSKDAGEPKKDATVLDWQKRRHAQLARFAKTGGLTQKSS